jgi:hypothetical protein
MGRDALLGFGQPPRSRVFDHLMDDQYAFEGIL